MLIQALKKCTFLGVFLLFFVTAYLEILCNSYCPKNFPVIHNKEIKGKHYLHLRNHDQEFLKGTVRL